MPVFQDMPITQITRGKVRDFLLDKANEGYAASTVTHIRNVISGVLNKAVDDEVIPANPSHRMGKIGKSTDRRKNINPLSQDELNTLLMTAYQHFPADFTLLLTLARTGIRIGEALGLKWEDINFEGRAIDVQRSFVRGRISTPKSGKYRTVDATPQLVETLKRHRSKQMRDAFANGRGEVSEWVFMTDGGTLINKDIWRKRVFNKLLKKAKLRKVRIHDLRHTYATLRISKGDNIADVSKQLGHHSVKLTMDVYYHWIPGSKKSEVDGLDDPLLAHPFAPYPHPRNKKGSAE
jgi:integrase